MKNHFRHILASSLFAMVLSVATWLQAASITWNPIQTATGTPSDVVTTGSFFDSATSYPTADVTLNGVLFKRNLNNDNFNNSFIKFTNRASGPSTFATPPGTWDANYRTLGSWGIYQTTGSGGVDISLRGLAIGKNYEVQLWVPYWNNTFTTQFNSGNASGFLNLGYNPTNVTSQYVVGQFTADAGTQTINAIGPVGGYGIPGFLQVRNLTDSTGPAFASVPGRMVSVDLDSTLRANVSTVTAAGFKADISAVGQNATNDQIGVWETGTTSNWWNYTGNSVASGLVDSQGNAWNLTIGMSGVAGNAANWSNVGFTTPNDDLVNDGFYAGETGTVTTTIGNLSPGKLYDLIVYHADDYVAENVTVNGVSAVNYTGLSYGAYADAFDGLSGSDFWYFRNLSPNGLNQLVISSSGGAGVGFGAANTITGFQLVQIPEPSSLALLALGGVFFNFFKWRRGH